MAVFDFMLCGADEEILKALRIVDDISNIDNSASRNYSNDHVKESDLPDSSYDLETVSLSVTNFSEDSGCPKSHKSKTENEESQFLMELEYQNFLTSISALRTMCSLCIEKSKKMEAENNEQTKMQIEGSKQILSASMLSENLINIKTTISHVVAIAEQFTRIKQVLRNGPSKSTLKVNPSCQKNVIEFFHLANGLMGSLEKDKMCIEACLENNVDTWNPTSRQLQLQIGRILGDTVRRIDNLIEFRSNLAVLSTCEELARTIDVVR